MHIDGNFFLSTIKILLAFLAFYLLSPTSMCVYREVGTQTRYRKSYKNSVNQSGMRFQD